MSEILFPCGRMIGGSVYTAQPETDNFEKPKLNADGTPKTSFSFGVAIPKGGEAHWSQTPWGAQVLAVGASSHPQQHGLPSYAWKIKDGDSKVPNRVGKIPSNSEGHAGNWIIWFKQSWAPKLVAEKGSLQLIEPEAVMPGYYIEVLASVVGNTGPSPGLYMNPLAVNRVAFGPRLATASVDTTSVGFGQSAIPAGASATPVGGGFAPAPFNNLQAQVGAASQGFNYPANPLSNPAASYPQSVGQVGYPQTPMGFNVVAPPNPAFLQIPAVPGVPAVRAMTAKAGGASYESFTSKGWTDALLTEHGYM